MEASASAELASKRSPAVGRGSDGVGITEVLQSEVKRHREGKLHLLCFSMSPVSRAERVVQLVLLLSCPLSQPALQLGPEFAGSCQNPLMHRVVIHGRWHLQVWQVNHQISRVEVLTPDAPEGELRLFEVGVRDHQHERPPAELQRGVHHSSRGQVKTDRMPELLQMPLPSGSRSSLEHDVRRVAVAVLQQRPEALQLILAGTGEPQDVDVR